ncbi:MAG: caspase domain-containing protein [Acidobacteriota bacterium]
MGARVIERELTMMRVRAAVVAMVLAAVGCAGARAQDERCGSGKDLVVQALERVRPTSGDDAFEDALQLLKQAVETCTELGDAWYYRSLVEQRLGNARLAAYSLSKAKEFGSEAMQEGLNPFVLATPTHARALTGGAPPAGEPPAGTPAAPGPVQNKWALVVGISHFADRAIPTLNYTTQDAGSFAAELKDPVIGRFPADNVSVLTDDQATTKNIKERLNWIARHAQPNDLVVIYVATHGSPRSLDTAGGANYIVTYDTEIKSVNDPDQDALYATALPMVELANAVATRMKALRTAVILDTCYSGGAVTNGSQLMGKGVANAAPSAATLERMTEGTGRIVIAAARANEESLESDQLHHGYFTYFLLQAIKAKQGLDPLTDVYSTVAQEVTQRVAADAKADGVSLGQHPVMSRSTDNGDFALGITGGGGVASGR